MQIFVIGGATNDQDRLAGHGHDLLRSTAMKLGEEIALAGHDLIVCSPFEISVDVDVARGFDLANGHGHIRFHIPDQDKIEDCFQEFKTTLKAAPLVHRHPLLGTEDSSDYSWLLCHLRALDNCDVLVAIGGKEGHAASLLLELARARRSPVLPVPCFGGAARRTFQEVRDSLELRLRDDVELLRHPESVPRVVALAEALIAPPTATKPLRLGPGSHAFLSYAHERMSDADLVETLLRRQGVTVTRDEEELKGGDLWRQTLSDGIATADAFVALWSQEYALSEMCWDEIEQALDRKMQILIITLDATPVLPRRARGMQVLPGSTRKEIRAALLNEFRSGRP
jgi:hypothetical protein